MLGGLAFSQRNNYIAVQQDMLRQPLFPRGAKPRFPEAKCIQAEVLQ
jgi:hypothetical protein